MMGWTKSSAKCGLLLWINTVDYFVISSGSKDHNTALLTMWNRLRLVVTEDQLKRQEASSSDEQRSDIALCRRSSGTAAGRVNTYCIRRCTSKQQAAAQVCRLRTVWSHSTRLSSTVTYSLLSEIWLNRHKCESESGLLLIMPPLVPLSQYW